MPGLPELPITSLQTRPLALAPWNRLPADTRASRGGPRAFYPRMRGLALARASHSIAGKMAIARCTLGDRFTMTGTRHARSATARTSRTRSVRSVVQTRRRAATVGSSLPLLSALGLTAACGV